MKPPFHFYVIAAIFILLGLGGSVLAWRKFIREMNPACECNANDRRP